MHGTQGNIVTWTQKPVYGDLVAGKLERSNLVRVMLVPHQQRFDGDSEACFSVAVHYLSAPAFEQGVVAAMPALSHSTAAATPFAGVVGINNVECDVLVEAPCLEVLSKLVERDAQDFPVELLRFGVEWFKVFYADVSIVSQSQVGDVSDNLANAVSDEVPLIVSDSPELFPSVLAGCSDRLQPASMGHGTFSANPDVFPIVELLQNLTFWCEDGCSEAFAVYIDSDHIFAGRQLDLLVGEEGNDLSTGCESVCLTDPTTLNQGSVSLVVPILDNWNRNICFGFDTQRHEEPSFGVEGLAVAGNVEFDCNVFEFITLGFDDTTLNVADDLTVEGGGLLDL
jgi:hypothetical protein